MSANVECKSSFQVGDGDTFLNTPELQAWLTGLPLGASLSAITRDYGSQRDPMPTLVGLVAKWSEVR